MQHTMKKKSILRGLYLLLLTCSFSLNSLGTQMQNSSYFPTFEEGMGPTYNVEKVRFGKTHKKLFLQNNFEVAEYSKETIMPKIIHQIWIGSPVPEKFKSMMDSWKKVHPDWEYKLWTDEDIEDFPFINGDLFHASTNFGMKSDIWRYEILSMFGGVYVDIDFEAVKPLDIFAHTSEFFAGVDGGDYVGNSFFGSIPNHPILLFCIEKLKAQTKTNLSHDQIQNSTGPYFFTDKIRKVSRINSDKIAIYPGGFFFPFPLQKRHDFWNGYLSKEEIKQTYFKPYTYAVHYWATSWMVKKKKK